MLLLQSSKLDKAELSLQAPSEAESQCAQMCKDGVVSPAGSCLCSGATQFACMVPLTSSEAPCTPAVCPSPATPWTAIVSSLMPPSDCLCVHIVCKQLCTEHCWLPMLPQRLVISAALQSAITAQVNSPDASSGSLLMQVDTCIGPLWLLSRCLPSPRRTWTPSPLPRRGLYET